LVISIFPYLIGMSGLVYLGAALILGAMFLYHVIKMFNEKNEQQPIKTFVFSINYLMWLFAVMLIDHYIPLVSRLFS